MPEKTIKVADLAKVQDIEFVSSFGGSVKKLLEILGKTDVEFLPAGSVLKVYKTSGTLDTDQVGEGEEINLSKYENKLADTLELDVKKFRKSTSVEAVAKRGYEQAVTKTDSKMVGDIQKSIRKDIFTFLGTGTKTTTGTTFQEALANAWANVSISFEDDDATPVYFANQLDLADYLGKSSVTIQTAFGLSYIENFMGLGTVVLSSDVPKGTVFGTAAENIVIAACDVNTIQGFDLYTDETGFIGVTHSKEASHGALDTVAIVPMKIYGEYLDRIVKATIAPKIGG